MSDVLSFGGGVNSVALAILLVNEGWRGRIVFSDTGTEWPDTYCYMEMFEREWLKTRGLKITRLGAEWRSPSRNCSMIELCERRHMLPVGRGGRWCTSDYKVRPFKKWARANGRDPDDAMLGIAADEAWRRGTACRPLVDRHIGRDGCVQIIKDAGLPVPHKSGCYICPFQRNSQWLELWKRYPELFARAEALEADRVRSGRTGVCTIAMDGRTTLALRRLSYESQMQLFDDEELMEYRPCMCQL